jgi:hypothetical protein
VHMVFLVIFMIIIFKKLFLVKVGLIIYIFG